MAPSFFWCQQFFQWQFSNGFFQNRPKSVKAVASENLSYISRTKTVEALIFVVNDKDKVVLTISLSLKVSNMFPYRKFCLKVGSKSNLSKNRKIMQKKSFFYLKCDWNIHCVPILSKNIDFWKIRAFSIYMVNMNKTGLNLTTLYEVTWGVPSLKT